MVGNVFFKCDVLSSQKESRRENDKVIITIEDNGLGISKSDMKKIKEPFYTTKPQGSGLGVSLSYEIIHAHNGNINYYSKIGKGTKVIIELPINLELTF